MMNGQTLWLEDIDVLGIFCPDTTGRKDADGPIQKVFGKGEYLYLPDDPADKVFFLIDGRVKVGIYGESGKEITKAVLGRGSVFGELSLIGEDHRRDFAFAMEDSRVSILTVEAMNAMMRDHSGLSLFLMRAMGARVRELEHRLESLIFKDSRTRVVEFLYDLARRCGQRVGYEMLIRNFFTHQEIANFTATSRQTVTTVLNDLRSRNIITFNRRRLLVRDMGRLEKEMN